MLPIVSHVSNVTPAWDLRVGDCLDPVAGLACLPDRSVDHVITDPPYEREAHTQGRRIKRGARGVRVEPLDFHAIDPAVRAAVARELARVARRWIVVFSQVEAVGAWRDALVAAGATYRRTCAWVKPDAQPQLSGDRPGMGYESIVCCHAPGRSRWNGGGRAGVYSSVRASTEQHRPNLHMTEKPLGLIEALVRDFTDPGDLVVDPFAGAGTTGYACVRLGRRFLGWEIEPRFAAVARRRIGAAREQVGLPGIGA